METHKSTIGKVNFFFYSIYLCIFMFPAAFLHGFSCPAACNSKLFDPPEVLQTTVRVWDFSKACY